MKALTDAGNSLLYYEGIFQTELSFNFCPDKTTF